MFLLTLGGSLVLGAGLLAAASYSEGTFLALRTAAQAVGWLLLLATVVGIQGLRQATFGALGTATVTFVSGLAVLYMAYFQWGEAPQAAIRHAAAGEIVAIQHVDYDALAAKTDAFVAKTEAFAAKTVAFASEPEAARLAIALKEVPPPLPLNQEQPAKELVASVRPAPKVADACPALAGVELLQCRRCARTEGLRWMLCQERVRLEYCEGQGEDAAACPSAISYSPPA